jgi:hypothetical protein
MPHHIVIIDSSDQDRLPAMHDIKKDLGSPTLQVSGFRTLGEFILSYEKLPDVDLIITEKFLNLIEVNEDSEKYVERLTELFPNIVNGWDGKNGAETLILHLRKNGLNTPVIIYTGLDREYVEESLTDKNVHYCKKLINFALLNYSIRKVLCHTN